MDIWDKLIKFFPYLALKEGKVKDGTVICMLAAGIGYAWAANIVKWGVAQ